MRGERAAAPCIRRRDLQPRHSCSSCASTCAEEPSWRLPQSPYLPQCANPSSDLLCAALAPPSRRPRAALAPPSRSRRPRDRAALAPAPPSCQSPSCACGVAADVAAPRAPALYLATPAARAVPLRMPIHMRSAAVATGAFGRRPVSRTSIWAGTPPWPLRARGRGGGARVQCRNARGCPPVAMGMCALRHVCMPMGPAAAL